MERYDYMAAVCEDVRAYIESEEITVNEENREEVAERLNDELWTNDGVTGNGCGSYTFSTWQAEDKAERVA